MKYFLLIIALFSFYSQADSIYVGGWSKHLESAHATNETHNFLVIEHNGYVAGRFTSSYGDEIYTVGKKYNIGLLSSNKYNIETNIGPLVTYGYKTCSGGRNPKIDYRSYSTKACVTPLIEVQYTEYRIRPTAILLVNGVVFAININY